MQFEDSVSSHISLFADEESEKELPNNRKISARSLVLVYLTNIGLDFQHLIETFRDLFDDQNLIISSVHWTLEKKQIFLLRLSQKRCLSRKKWEDKLIINGAKPSMISYDRYHFSDLAYTLASHWPQLKPEKMKKLMSKEMDARKYLDSNPAELFNYPQIKKSLEVLEAQEKEKELRQLKLPKKRGIYLFGKAGSGKTTLAMDCLLPQPIYQKTMTTKTFDDYSYQPSILYDQLNPDNAKNQLSQLKNVVNVIPASVDVKFSHKLIYPSTVVITSQYLLHQLVKDNELIEAIRKRFFFYHVKLEESSGIVIFKEYAIDPNDQPAATAKIYSQQFKKVMTEEEYEEACYSRDFLARQQEEQLH